MLRSKMKLFQVTPCKYKTTNLQDLTKEKIYTYFLLNLSPKLFFLGTKMFKNKSIATMTVYTSENIIMMSSWKYK